MATRINQVLDTVDGAVKEKPSTPEGVTQEMIDRYEINRNKSEADKRHDRFRAAQKRSAYAVEIPIQPAKRIAPKAGTYFAGTLPKLIEEYGPSLSEIWRYMTMGQLAKYYVVEGNIWSHKTGQMAYNAETGECFE